MSARTLSLVWDSIGQHDLRAGTQRVPKTHGENDVQLSCPNLDHRIHLYRHFLTNIRDPLTVGISCEGNLDEIRCVFLDEGKSVRRTTTCSKHDPLHAVW
jgi:hypothetical protein